MQEGSLNVEREREVKDWRKEGNGSKGRGFVREFLTKKQEDLSLGREDLGTKTSIFGTKKGSIWEVKCNSLFG